MDSTYIGTVIKEAREARGWTQAHLGRLVGVKQQSLDAIESGKTGRSKFLPEIARELGIAPESVGLPPDPPPGTVPVTNPYGPRDFMIYAAAQGGAGEIIRSVEPVDWWPRPIALQHVKGAYGIYVVGDSMWPEFEAGQVAEVNPNLPHTSNKCYIFYAEDESGQVRATVKRLRKVSGDAWHVMQHNPPAGQEQNFELPRSVWVHAHRIVGRQDPG